MCPYVVSERDAPKTTQIGISCASSSVVRFQPLQLRSRRLMQFGIYGARGFTELKAV